MVRTVSRSQVSLLAAEEGNRPTVDVWEGGGVKEILGWGLEGASVGIKEDS